MPPLPSDQRSQYELRAPLSGAGILDPRTALLFWGAGSILLGVIVSILLVQGEVRMLVLVLLGVLGLVCLAPRRGVYILLTFLPFMYYIRRLVLNFQSFDSRDPILLFPALTTVGMFFGAILFYSPRLFRYIQASALMKTVALLMGVFVLQMANPLQGNILVGVAGAMYFIVPMAWCFFGLLMNREDIWRLCKIVVVIGLVTALYGLYQHFFGLSAVELYEMKAKDFLKTLGGTQNVRIMSTFASLGDFSLYLSVAGFLSFAWFWRSKKQLTLLGITALSLYTMVWMAVRTAFLLFVFSVTIFLIVHGRDRRRILIRGTLAVLAFATIYSILATYDPQSMYDQQFSDNPYVVHTLSGLTHPIREQTFGQRLENWRYIVTSTIFGYPFGRGLGSTTTAAKKFEGGKDFEADSYFFELFYGSGFVAPVLFSLLVLLCLRNLVRLCIERPDEHLYKAVAGLLCGMFLGSLFGGAVRDTIMGPFIWLTIGWSVREEIEHREQRLAGAGP